MIHFYFGENSFEIERELARMVRAFEVKPEMIDGQTLEVSQLPDLLMGTTLFAKKRLVIIKDLSQNKSVWDALPEWLERVSADVTLVLVESKPDKRTKTYKELIKHVEKKEFPVWGERESYKAEAWVQEEARRRNAPLTSAHAKRIVARAGLDQWALSGAIDKLALLEEVTPEIIDDIIDQRPEEDVFGLLGTALLGDSERVHEMIRTLRRTSDPYQTFGLLASQIVQLRLLTLADASPSQVAADSKVHPYGLSKLAPHANRLGERRVKALLDAAAETDVLMKSTSHDPWRLIELLLVRAAE